MTEWKERGKEMENTQRTEAGESDFWEENNIKSIQFC